MPIDPRLVGRRISEIRELTGRSLSSVAEDAGIAKSYLSRLEGGEVENPGLSTLHAVADALDVTLADLVRPAALVPVQRQRAAHSKPVKSLPPSLQAFIAKRAKIGDPLPPDAIESLAGLRFKGQRPERAEDWDFIFQALVRSVGRR